MTGLCRLPARGKYTHIKSEFAPGTKWDLNRPVPSTVLPPAGDLELHLEIAYTLSEGDMHTVYEVVPIKSHASSEVFNMPPMLIKVAANREGRRIAEEAAMYDHLLDLQGIAIPRCYGYFRCVINHQENAVLPWDPDCAFPRSEETFDIFDFPNSHASLNVLLLEYVGDNLTCGSVSLERLASDLRDMTEELSQCIAFHRDMKRENVFWTGVVYGGDVPSSRHNRVYSYRIIDFESAELTAMSPEKLHREYGYNINEILYQAGYRGW